MARILTLTLNPALDLTVQLETLQPGAVNRSTGFATHAAGKGLNVAQVLADLDHRITVSGFLGESNPALFEALFSRRGFVDAFIRVPGETRSNIKLAERSGRVTDLNGSGPEVGPAHRDALAQRLDEIVSGHDAVVVAGSLPRGVDPEWFCSFLRIVKRHDVPLVLDTSGEALRLGLKAKPWLIKPNEHELAEILRLPDSARATVEKAARTLQGDQSTHVLLSMGSDGVSWFGPDISLHAQPPKVDVRSTVGAGDSLLAGLLHGLLSDAAPEETLRHATAIAAQAVTQVGFGIHDREQLTRLDAAVQLTRLQEEE
ncbi:1-phosphofructokinase [Pseudomonas matsuisoli]|uniref:Phosphofructokinase n=1 Tax=Pseudomonas matsuisoli TaxID=1515666 RepID=A0A917PWJ0_9PSED|nr:1-phosphofructokinase [Pseudomonas matsuisoli]GGJ96861.1 phosphofructokinase [Pseudomonas matsuisoli]